MIPFLSQFFAKSDLNEELYQITNKSGQNFTQLYVQFRFTDHVTAESTLGYSMGMSIVDNVSVEKPLKNGDTLLVRVNNLAREIFSKKDVQILDLIGILVSIDDVKFINVTGEDWANQMTIGKAVEIRSIYSNSKSYSMEAFPSN